ncbi:MAG TPA: hypothetical protein VGQ04_12175 [Chitinophagaceae bacterium]|nr:hypothetical protein [Chitinophagaceae bacterium]
MTTVSQRSKNSWILVPFIGSFLFIILYIIAAFLYPGGSGKDKAAIGYSWTDNYWCNLLGEKAINGQTNAARPVAVTAMFILCLSLSTFWILFPALTQLKKFHKLLIQVAGTVCMLASFLLLTPIDHDLAVNTSSAFGLIAMIGILIALYQLKWNWLFAIGLFNLLLVTLNNYLYHSNEMMYLPIVQKFSFLSFLVWFSFISINLYQRPMRVVQKLN